MGKFGQAIQHASRCVGGLPAPFELAALPARSDDRASGVGRDVIDGRGAKLGGPPFWRISTPADLAAVEAVHRPGNSYGFGVARPGPVARLTFTALPG